MNILDRKEIKKITDAIDYILNNHMATVKQIKKRFDLTDEEYDMIDGLMMPAIRQYHEAKFWRMGFCALKDDIERTVANPKNKSTLIDDIKKACAKAQKKIDAREAE